MLSVEILKTTVLYNLLLYITYCELITFYVIYVIIFCLLLFKFFIIYTLAKNNIFNYYGFNSSKTAQNGLKSVLTKLTQCKCMSSKLPQFITLIDH